MIEIQDTYLSFRGAQSRYLGRGFRIPKNWDSVWSKMTKENVKQLELITIAFNTRWQNIDMDRYFDYGFELHGKAFSYSKFYDRRILLSYIEKDKQLKRTNGNVLECYNNSIYYIKEWMDKHEFRSDLNIYSQYCRMNEDGMKAPIKHFLLNRIDKHTLAFLISQKFLILEDYERALIPLVMKNYWTLSEEINRVVNNIFSSKL